MNHKRWLVSLFVVLAATLTFTVVSAQGPKPTPPKPKAPTVNVDAGTAFTYQGQLKNSGALVNGSCNFNFGLWDDSTVGSQVGATQTVTTTVTNGLFTTPIDFGGNAFTGDARWLAEAVRCPSGGGSYTALSPRQPLTPAPIAFSLPGLYTTQNITSPNVIGGYSGNTVDNGKAGATIAGGGQSGFINHVTSHFGTIGGGSINTASFFATVGGGSSNTASNTNATIAGGNGNTASGIYATVGGGVINTANGRGAFIGGGGFDGPNYLGNHASGDGSTIGGGLGNQASGYASFIGGGGGFYSSTPISNTASGDWSVVGGGASNIASGAASTIPGGNSNLASGGNSFAAGTAAQAKHDGAFVWADSTSYSGFASTAANQFLVRASGGITMYTNSGLSAGVQLAPGGGSWGSVSDQNVKANFAATNGADILARVAHLPIQTWNYTTQDPSIRHIGPMAQDFHAAFNVGEDDKHITTIDSEGVALAAIQGLYQLVQDEIISRDAEIAGLKTQVASQENKIGSLEARLAALEQAMKENGIAVRADSNAASTQWFLFSGLLFVGVIFWRHNAGGKG